MTELRNTVAAVAADADMPRRRHIPVMQAEVLNSLIAARSKAQTAAARLGQRLAGMRIIDGTFGYGGYSRAFLAEGANVLGLDCDPQAVRTGQILAAESHGRFTMAETKFSCLDQAAAAAGFLPADAVVLDIGVSSMQIDNAERGFSFQKDGPLDMRMSSSGVSAAEVVNALQSSDLARIFHFYGEERHAGRIARMIERERQSQPFNTTLQLARAIEALGLHRQEKIHAATRVFQALRIYVNDELGELARALFAAERVLSAGGCLVVVSFHSLEDRIVKRFFTGHGGSSRHAPQQKSVEPSFVPIFKGAKTASFAELADNPRARSAKLRAGIRTQAAAPPDDFSIFKLPVLPPLASVLQQRRRARAGRG